jgi:hypothetical protein
MGEFMSLKNVHSMLIKLAETPSTNDKKTLLRKYLQDHLFQRVCVYALDSRITYHTKNLPITTKANRTGSPAKIFELLGKIAGKPGTSDAEKQNLANTANIDIETLDVVTRIVNKDLRCGVSKKTINSVSPGLIFDMPYCRCSTESKIDRITWPAFVQQKADGMFANLMLDKDTPSYFLTRDGVLVKQLTGLAINLIKSCPNWAYGHVVHGELLIKQNGEILDRKTSNGFLNSMIHGTAPQELTSGVVFHIWDMIPEKVFWKGSYGTPYKDRWNNVMKLASECRSGIMSCIDCSIAQTEIQARRYYAEMRDEGLEGAIIKDFNAKWKYHTSPLQIKLKNVMDVELIIVGWYYGDKGKKYEHCLGGLVLETACGSLQVNVGTGFSDEERGYRIVAGELDKGFAESTMEFWNSQIGGIAQVECESVIKSKTDKKHSLYLPRFVYIRDDKTEADTLKSLLNR